MRKPEPTATSEKELGDITLAWQWWRRDPEVPQWDVTDIWNLGKYMSFEAKYPWVLILPLPFQAMSLEASYLNSPSLSYLICKVGLSISISTGWMRGLGVRTCINHWGLNLAFILSYINDSPLPSGSSANPSLHACELECKHIHYCNLILNSENRSFRKSVYLNNAYVSTRRQSGESMDGSDKLIPATTRYKAQQNLKRWIKEGPDLSIAGGKIWSAYNCHTYE